VKSRDSGERGSSGVSGEEDILDVHGKNCRGEGEPWNRNLAAPFFFVDVDAGHFSCEPKKIVDLY
jgi:hypothetical protein